MRRFVHVLALLVALSSTAWAVCYPYAINNGIVGAWFPTSCQAPYTLQNVFVTTSGIPARYANGEWMSADPGSSFPGVNPYTYAGIESIINSIESQINVRGYLPYGFYLGEAHTHTANAVGGLRAGEIPGGMTEVGQSYFPQLSKRLAEEWPGVKQLVSLFGRYTTPALPTANEITAYETTMTLLPPAVTHVSWQAGNGSYNYSLGEFDTLAAGVKAAIAAAGRKHDAQYEFFTNGNINNPAFDCALYARFKAAAFNSISAYNCQKYQAMEAQVAACL